MTVESIYSLLSPVDLGLPTKFTSFRDAQAEALDWAVSNCHKRFTACCLPTGEGKSLFGAALAKILGVKAVYLTATRNLEDQVHADFERCGMVDARGRSNYNCAQLWPGRRYHVSCDYGHQHGCSLEHTERCGHDGAMLRASRSDLVVTNYSNWMYKRRYNKKAFEAGDDQPVELLVCDEAGEIAEQISSFVSVVIKHDDEELPVQWHRGEKDNPSGLMPDKTWSTWASERGKQAAHEQKLIADAKDDRHQYLTELRAVCDRIPQLDANWVWEVDDKGVRFEPIWPGREAQALWSGVKRIVLMSATLRPYTLQLLGIRESDYDYREWPSSFLPQYSPFYYHSAGTSLSWKSTADDWRQVIGLADTWIDARPGRRILVHSGSYERAKMFKALSRHSQRTQCNESGADAQKKARAFVSGPEDGILCGPSYTTGSNFPDRDCELNIIMKVPFPDERRRVMKERCKNRDYRMHVTVDKLVQIKGRHVRNAKDRGETVIFDDRIKWAMGSQANPWHGHAPKGFKCQQVWQVPPAPARVGK